MTCCNAQGPAICPCGQFNFPLVISNPAGLDAIAYRVGDYSSFRYAAFAPACRRDRAVRNRASPARASPSRRSGSPARRATSRSRWSSGGPDVSDILTFYNERVANESYLRTASCPRASIV